MNDQYLLMTVVLAVLAVAAGFVGGVVSSWILRGRPVFAQPAPQPAKVIQAERVEIVDKNGKVRAKLGIEDDGGEPHLGLYEKDGKPRIGLDPGALVIGDQNGAPRAALALLNGRPTLNLYDKDGNGITNGITTLSPSGLAIADQNRRPRLWLTLLNGEPSVGLNDKDEEPRVGLTLLNGEPRLELYDKDRKSRAKLYVNADGEPHLVLFDKDEKTRSRLYVNADGEPLLALFDENEEPRLVLTVNVLGEPGLAFSNDEGPCGGLSLSEDGEPMLMLGGKGALVTLSASKRPYLSFDSEDASVSLSTFDGKSRLELHSKDASVHLRADAEGPALDLHDSRKGKERATLGYSELSRLTKPN